MAPVERVVVETVFVVLEVDAEEREDAYSVVKPVKGSIRPI